MFDRAIIDTDRFMDLSMSAKALYFLLGMEADDEGFVSYKKVMRIHGGNEDDVKILAVKRFIIAFKSGVVVVTDWNTNNYLDKNRIRKTEYQIERKKLHLTNDGKYEFNIGSTSIEESSIEEKRIVAPKAGAVDAPFDWKEYLEGMFKNEKREDINVIALYFEEKKIKFDTASEASAAIKRHLRAAKEVAKFGTDKIQKAVRKAKEEYPTLWTVETILKILTR